VPEGPDAIAPDGSDVYFLVTDARQASLVEVRLGPGRTSTPVRHRTVEEIWYFLGGEGRVWRRPPGSEVQVSEVRAGSVLRIPTGWAFQFRAGAATELRFLCYTSPPWPGDEEAEAVPDLSPPPKEEGRVGGPGGGTPITGEDAEP
jgi:mannose-6-phosphate isomerase-like protein (cupin superfamily)